MECKNCSSSLRTDYRFCPDCGSKVVIGRITAKSLAYDFFERYFNLDNTFVRTIKHMVIKPQHVCGGYIAGLRKKYLNPVSMLAIALTISGFTVFLMKKVAWGKIDFSKINYGNTNMNSDNAEKLMSKTMEYGSLLFFLYIPIIAFASYVVFNKKNYNYPEHVVSCIYALTAFSIISVFYTVPILLISPQTYVDMSLVYVLVMFLFCIYVSYKNAMDKPISLLWQIPVYLLIVFIGYMGISLLSFIMLLVSGDISLQDFMPKK